MPASKRSDNGPGGEDGVELDEGSLVMARVTLKALTGLQAGRPFEEFAKVWPAQAKRMRELERRLAGQR